MCGPPRQHRHITWACRDCCGPMIFRRFHSKKERLEMLEKYKEQLKGELEGLTEEIERMSSK
jgi:hypothetical protein